MSQGLETNIDVTDRLSANNDRQPCAATCRLGSSSRRFGCSIDTHMKSLCSRVTHGPGSSQRNQKYYARS